MKPTAVISYVAVMFMGALVYGVQYSLSEYLSTFLVAGGVSMFALFKVNLNRFGDFLSSLAVTGQEN